MDKPKDQPKIKAKDKSDTSKFSYDKSYKLLFSHPEMVQSVLLNFVHEHFVSDLNFKSLSRLNGSYVVAKGNQRQYRDNDIIWRINWDKEGTVSYLILMLEFQRAPDHLMALRILNYTSLILQDLAVSKKLTEKSKLPLILPIVIYNGDKRWTAPLSVEQLFMDMPEGMEKYCPRQSYFLIDEKHGEYAKTQLDQSLMGNLIQINRVENLSEFTSILERLQDFFKLHPNEALYDLFKCYILDNIKSIYGNKLDLEMSDLGDINMVNERLLRNRDNLIAQGREENQIQSLKTLVTAKFPILPDALDEILIRILAKSDYWHLLQKLVKSDSWNDFIKGLPNH